MASSSDDSSSESDHKPYRSCVKRKRQKLVLNFSDSDDDSGDEMLFGKKTPPVTLKNNATPRVTMSIERVPETLSRKTIVTEKEKSRDEEDENSSVSTVELVRRINAPYPAEESPQRTSTSQQYNRAGNKSVNIESINKDSFPSKLTQLEFDEDDDDNGNKKTVQDDASSTSTTELARRARGESAGKPLSSINESLDSKPDQEPLEENGRSPLTQQVLLQTEIMAAAEDLYLPSPLPSDESSDEEEENDGDVEIIPAINTAHTSPIRNFNDAEENDDEVLIIIPTVGTSRTSPIHRALPADEVQRDSLHEYASQKLNSRDGGERESEAVLRRDIEQPLVREGMRDSVGPWARQRRLNATGALFSNQSRSSLSGWRNTAADDVCEDIEAFSDEDRVAVSARVRVEPESQASASSGRRRIRNVSDTSAAANVSGLRESFARSENSFGRTPRSSFLSAPMRNDLAGGSGVGAGQYQMISQPSEPPTRSSRPSRGGRGGKGGFGRRGGGRGRGRGRRRGSSSGRGRGSRGRTSNFQSNNAWSDYATQSVPWAMDSQPSNLGNVGGAEMSF